VPALAVTVLAGFLAGCGDGTASEPTTSNASALGAKIFADTSLSASGRQSCQTCHDFASGLAAPNAMAVQPGGINMERSGVRNTPSAAYMRTGFAFRMDPDGPVGGFFWDGRDSSLVAQAGEPFTNPLEMAMPTTPPSSRSSPSRRTRTSSGCCTARTSSTTSRRPTGA
jgi:cytochrome c peroxidase